jgi:hypothetical protein
MRETDARRTVAARMTLLNLLALLSNGCANQESHEHYLWKTCKSIM